MSVKIKEIIEIDGSQGEGGGQILRTSLSLSMITGKELVIHNIRAGRKKPGLLRQHLTAVLAAAKITDAAIVGAELGSKELVFKPKAIKAGDYEFSIGSAGSTTLVLQTLLPALLYAEGITNLVINGGTHNPLAPPVDFLQVTWLPLLKKMGADIELKLACYGFMPAGGGSLRVHIAPAKLQPIYLLSRGEVKKHHVKAIISGLPRSIAERQIARVQEKIGWTEQDSQIIHVDSEQGPGNALIMQVSCEHLTESFCAFGEPRQSAEKVADVAIGHAKTWLASKAVVGEYLADQLLLPMALAGGGSFTCTTLSDHLTSNAEVIQKFLPVKILYKKLSTHCIQVSLASTI